LIGDGVTIATGGFVGIGFAENIAVAIEQRFLGSNLDRGKLLGHDVNLEPLLHETFRVLVSPPFRAPAARIEIFDRQADSQDILLGKTATTGRGFAV